MEKNAVRQARAGAVNISKPPGSNNSANNSQSSASHMFEDNFTSNKGQNQQSFQLQAQQEEVDLQALEEQERTIRELEVKLYCRLDIR